MEVKNVFGTLFAVFILFSSMFVSLIGAAPIVAAYNGLGEVTQFQTEEGYAVTPPDMAVITTNVSKDIKLWIHNNDDPSDGVECVDEIIVTFPHTWNGTINNDTSTDPSTVSNLGPVLLSNEKDDGTYSGLVSDRLSLRIIPDHDNGGVMLCPSGTTEITLKGLVAPEFAEETEVMIMTSDEHNNEPNNQDVRAPLHVLPVIKVTEAERVKLEYVQTCDEPNSCFGTLKTGDQKGGITSDFSFVGTGKGAMGQITELYVLSNGVGSIDVYLDRNGDGDFDSNEYRLTNSAIPINVGINTIPLTEYNGASLTGKYTEGFIHDGKKANFFIQGAPGLNLDIVGHKDIPLDPDESVIGTGYEGDVVGTVITVNDAPTPSDGRTIKAQLVKEDVDVNGNTIVVDVRDNNVPIFYTTTYSGGFTEASPEPTDVMGEVELNLLPSTLATKTTVKVCFPDEACETEHIGIKPGPHYSFEITQGKDTEVMAGENEQIEVTIYDEYGNVVSNTPLQPHVTFELLSGPTGSALDDDVFVGSPSNWEEEDAEMGKALVNLQTSPYVGDHVVEACVQDLPCTSCAGGVTLGCKNTTVKGVLGQAEAVDCVLNDVHVNPTSGIAEIDADDCFNVLVHVVDENGNPLEKWESIVEISLDDLDLSGNGTKYIKSTDLREEVFMSSTKVKGKLNNNLPAYANVEVCGCEGLGEMDVVCKSDTLETDYETLEVRNSNAMCIDIEATGISECDYEGQLGVSIVDTCGNKLIDQECGTDGWASSCVELQTTCGTLSTDKTCVDLKDTGMAPLVDFNFEGCACPDVTLTAVDEPDCCPSVYSGKLPVCPEADTHFPVFGPTSQIELDINPYADNQDDFYVSEIAEAELTLKDSCDNVNICDDERSVDFKLTGEDCSLDEIQVDSPFEATSDLMLNGCSGDIACDQLTVFGEDKCLETPGCAYNMQKTGTCTGVSDCVAITDPVTCELWGCHFNAGVCGGVIDYACDDPLNPAGGNHESCEDAGCTYTPDYLCEGTATPGACMDYTKDQCDMIEDYYAPTQTCEWVEEKCIFSDKPVHKVVIENCADGSKAAGNKEWTDLPEKDDLVVDKIAFEYNGPQTEVIACIYEETEETAGFQPDEDIQWNCVDLSTVPTAKLNDFDNYPQEGAWDQFHDSDGIRDGVGDVYIIELDDRISKYNDHNEYDNQRLGGSVIEPGDTKDFYIVLSTKWRVDCGTYDADYLYYQDYNSPDIVFWGYGGEVRDQMAGSEEYTRRNDDYTGADPYPVTTAATPSYGFGDRILENLGFVAGKAFVYFRDLVSEMVEVNVGTSLPVTLVGGPKAMPDDQAKVLFNTQPATQIVARNHGDLSLSDAYPMVCDDAGFEPDMEWDPDWWLYFGPHLGEWHYGIRECRPAKACSDEGYDVNLQITDGFQNQVGLETEVQLQSCLTYPHYIYLGDSMLGIDVNVTVDLWDWMNLVHPDIHDVSEPWDVCYDSEKFKEALMDIIAYYTGDKDQLDSFINSAEFSNFLDSIFEDKTVRFLDENGVEITQTDAAGHLIVKTDSDGKAKVRVESDDASFAQIKSFDASYRLFFVPHALDADYFDVAFAPGDPAVWDIMAWPEYGIPADGEQESMVLIRKLDACGNPVAVNESAKVTATSASGRAVISKDFSWQNNYDNEVEGSMREMSCMFLFPWFEDCSLTVLDDVIEPVTLKVEDVSCDAGVGGHCDGPVGSGCDQSSLDTQSACFAWDVECQWVTGQGNTCQRPDEVTVDFVGAPTKLAITEIKHSDLIPADGYVMPEKDIHLPMDACDIMDQRKFDLWELFHAEPEMCRKDCVSYGNTGGWVTVQIQDKFGNRVSSYLGDGFARDPGDVNGLPDYTAEKICVGLDDPRAFIQDYIYGFSNLEQVDIGESGTVYCGDLTYGQGSFKVVYSMLDGNMDPLDPRETEKVIVSVFDVCDYEMFDSYGIPQNKLEQYWDDYCNAQEYNENNLPDSETASRLNPDSDKMIFTSVPDRWDIEADKYVVAADGEDYAEVTINVENEFMDVRASVDATVQSSLLGSTIESEAITPGCYVKGIYDPINPTSINVMTEDCSGGRAKLKIRSTKPGVARVTVTGNYFGCTRWKETQGPMELAVPICTEWGVIPMTPKTIEVEFQQAFQDKVELKEGWNFFSVPYELAVGSRTWSELGLSSVCYASASWDDSGQTFVGQTPVPGNTVLMPQEGYWCYIQSGDETTIEFVKDTSSGLGVYLPPIKTIYPGWNDVALSNLIETKIEHALISIDNVYSLVLDWVEQLQRYEGYANTGEAGGGDTPGTTGTKTMESGQAYFIRASGSGDLVGMS